MYATVKPYDATHWQVVAVRATESAARKLKVPAGGGLIRARFVVKPRQLFTERAAFDWLLPLPNGPKRKAVRKAKSNPPAARVVMSRRVLKLYYVHAGDGKAYVHEFAPGVTLEALGNREVRLFRPDGRSISQDF